MRSQQSEKDKTITNQPSAEEAAGAQVDISQIQKNELEEFYSRQYRVAKAMMNRKKEAILRSTALSHAALLENFRQKINTCKKIRNLEAALEIVRIAKNSSKMNIDTLIDECIPEFQTHNLLMDWSMVHTLTQVKIITVVNFPTYELIKLSHIGVDRYAYVNALTNWSEYNSYNYGMPLYAGKEIKWLRRDKDEADTNSSEETHHTNDEYTHEPVSEDAESPIDQLRGEYDENDSNVLIYDSFYVVMEKPENSKIYVLANDTKRKVVVCESETKTIYFVHVKSNPLPEDAEYSGEELEERLALERVWKEQQEFEKKLAEMGKTYFLKAFAESEENYQEIEASQLKSPLFPIQTLPLAESEISFDYYYDEDEESVSTEFSD